jgi:hypothetical protein
MCLTCPGVLLRDMHAAVLLLMHMLLHGICYCMVLLLLPMHFLLLSLQVAHLVI